MTDKSKSGESVGEAAKWCCQFGNFGDGHKCAKQPARVGEAAPEPQPLPHVNLTPIAEYWAEYYNRPVDEADIDQCNFAHNWAARIRGIGREDAGSPAERQQPSKLHNEGSSPSSPSNSGNCEKCGKAKFGPWSTIASGAAGQIQDFYCCCGEVYSVAAQALPEREALQHEANELLRRLNRDVFNNAIDIAKLPYGVGIVMDWAEARGRAMAQAEREPVTTWTRKQWMDNAAYWKGQWDKAIEQRDENARQLKAARQQIVENSS